MKYRLFHRWVYRAGPAAEIKPAWVYFIVIIKALFSLAFFSGVPRSAVERGGKTHILRS